MDDSTRTLHAATDKLFDKRPVLRDDMQIARLEKLRVLAKQLAHGTIDVVPDGREKDRALELLADLWLCIEAGCEAHQVEGLPRITAARVDEAMARQMRDKGTTLPGE